MMPNFGERRRVWPREPNIPASANPGDMLPDEGRDVAWSDWWQARLNDGSISLHEPRAAAKPAPKKEG